MNLSQLAQTELAAIERQQAQRDARNRHYRARVIAKTLTPEERAILNQVKWAGVEFEQEFKLYRR